jgi:hypothetical protein
VWRWDDPRLCPWLSTFSPDGRKFMLGVSGAHPLFRLWLYSVPKEWLK